MKHDRITLISLLLLLCLLLAACGEGAVPVGGSGADTTELPESTLAPETDPPVPQKRVAITYDDGPSRQGLTEKLVDEFRKYGGKATFFVLGNLITDSTGEALAYADSHGFEIGIHAYTHEYYFDSCSESIFLNELRMTEEAIKRYIKGEVTLLRAPGGSISKERAQLGGYPVINWSIDTEDWRYKSRADDAAAEQNIDTIVRNALENVEDGDIILMHEIYTNSYEASCRILRELDAMGFAFVTVSELFGEGSLTAGETYYSAPPVNSPD